MGAITGFYVDINGAHGFLRSPDGTFTTFDVPGFEGGTLGFAINPAGDITGVCSAEPFTSHGFLRARDGTITTFDVPDAPYFTRAFDINPAGAITGWYVGTENAFHID